MATINKSPSKQKYSFSKANRFPDIRRSYCQNVICYLYLKYLRIFNFIEENVTSQKPYFTFCFALVIL